MSNGEFGITSWYGTLVVRNCRVMDNSASGVYGGHVRVEDSIIAHNRVTGVIARYDGDAIGSLIADNGSAGFACGRHSRECEARGPSLETMAAMVCTWENFTQSASLLIEDSAIMANRNWGSRAPAPIPAPRFAIAPWLIQDAGRILWQDASDTRCFAAFDVHQLDVGSGPP